MEIGQAVKFENGDKYVIPKGKGYPSRLEGKILNTEYFSYEPDEMQGNSTNNLLLPCNTYISQVKEFMTLFGQPVVNKPAIMPEDRNKLRIALIFEELKEYAEASGLKHYFSDLCHTGKMSIQEQIDYKIEIDLVEQFDALLDLQYVLSGAVLENGFGDIFDKGFDEVHRSNMSKCDLTEEDAQKSCDYYTDNDIETYYKYNPFAKLYLIYRSEDNKVLKSHKYSPANLLPIIEEASYTQHND